MREEAPTSVYPESQVKLTEIPTVTVGEEREDSPWRRGGGASHNTAGGPVKISKGLGFRLGEFGRISSEKVKRRSNVGIHKTRIFQTTTAKEKISLM